jgi:hypothetical protein
MKVNHRGLSEVLIMSGVEDINPGDSRITLYEFSVPVSRGLFKLTELKILRILYMFDVTLWTEDHFLPKPLPTQNSKTQVHDGTYRCLERDSDRVILVFKRSNIVPYFMSCCIERNGSTVEMTVLLSLLMWSLKCRHQSAWKCCRNLVPA